MVGNVVTKPLGFVLIVTAHMVFNGPSHETVTGILGNNITLQFTFQVNFTNRSRVAAYIEVEKKISDNLMCKACFDIYPVNSSVFYHIKNLNLNHSEIYYATVFMDKEPAKQSNRVQLIVQEQNMSTVPPMSTMVAVYPDSGSSSFYSFHIMTVLVVSPVVLLAALLPVLVYCLMKTKDKQQHQPQHSSNPTMQETFEVSSNMPASSLVYSVLDFPKRLPAVVEMDPSDTEYAAVSYLPETRRI
ncbi:uncharacterized protein LOC118471144 [Amphiprion ocellaris]|uniref:uncharacterized protein LOC118471144 n=1 Tax=Amphiprion ocellaris TaxID=80972 RepID=UPI0024110998|nr:uncharacterized protein LOC118471144 [Amphiprion ocellaris]